MVTETKDGIVFEYPDDDEIPGTTGNKVNDETEVDISPKEAQPKKEVKVKEEKVTYFGPPQTGAYKDSNTFAVVHLIDNLVFQPLIYSSSVHAHPLEIFLVILMAGSLYGVPGMVVAIPAYTVLRVFAREFLYNFKLVKKLTGKMKK